MTKDLEEGNKQFAVIHRWLDDDDVLHMRLLVLITDAPYTLEVSRLKSIIDAIGDDFLDGLGHKEAINWEKGYKVVPDDQWNDALKAEVKLLAKQASRVDEECDGVPYIREPEDSDAFIILDEDHLATMFCRRVAFQVLVDSLQGERRITLRLPLGLHTALGRTSYERGYRSTNSFCIQTLADVVGYKEEVKEFEAQRRKPGRPKKVQDSE